MKRYARRLGRTPGETGRILLDQALREIEFAHIEFRDTPSGRQAYLKGRRIQVWMAIMIAEGYNNDVKKTAKHLDCPEEWILAAFDYAKAFPDEISSAIEENDSFTLEDLKRTLPYIEEGDTLVLRRRN